MKGLQTQNWLVVSTHLKNISQIEHLPQIGMNIKKMKPPPRKTNLDPKNRLKKVLLSDPFTVTFFSSVQVGDLHLS